MRRRDDHLRPGFRRVALGVALVVGAGTVAAAEALSPLDLPETSAVAASRPEAVARFETCLEMVRTESPLWPLEPE